MSTADRLKWDRRYQEGAYRARMHPSRFLEECAPLLPPSGRALDLACGAGRNAIYLSGLGYAVDAVDISPEALAIGRSRSTGLPIRWLKHDLDAGFEPDGGYDIIVNIRFVNLPLLVTLVPTLRQNGVIIVEQHLATSRDDVIGPRNPAFRVASGQLAELASSLVIERLQEGVFVDPDGRKAALARLFARVGRVGDRSRDAPSQDVSEDC